MKRRKGRFVSSMSWPLTRKQLSKIHDATLSVLSKTGLRIDCGDFYEPLSAAGANVDRGSGVVRFPPSLVEETIEYLRGQIALGRRQYILNGVTNPRWTPPMGCKFGGACIEYLDLEANEVRPPTEGDLIGLLQLGEALDGVGFVGNPVTYLFDSSGRRVPGRLQRIKTAALVAKYTTKCGSTEVWNDQELELLLEIGEIVRGTRAAYEAQPCFITAKETIAPLQFPADDGRVLLMLARRGLPCMVIPMPLTGATCPCSPASNIVMCNAEILGVMAAIHAAVPEAMVSAGVISGTMDMSTGAATFSSPEALLQDAGLAQLYDKVYGQDLGLGTGYIDAKYPGAQSLAEKAMKMEAAAQQGRFNFPVGLLAGGKRFCPEQAVLELEVAEAICCLHTGVKVSDDLLGVDVIDEVGIGKEFLSHEHTLKHFRRTLWAPKIWDRRNPDTLAVEKKGDMLEAARMKVRDILQRDDLYRIDDDRARAIDEVVARAERDLP
ncbi:MAG: trimethylamine methyltransferase family protein [Phycisphaerae bacterium]|nr:trimethylamine methyltransferase family protein [Phycisphaerae bacterium]